MKASPRLPIQRAIYGALPVLLLVLLTPPVLQADDVTPPVQAEGEHAFLRNSEREQIRDDKLVDFICQQITQFGVDVKDIKLLVDADHGAGLLDDMERAFGAGGACPGIPWVAGTSGSLNQNNYSFGRVYDSDFQSSWTAALAGSNYEHNAVSPDGVIRHQDSDFFVLPDLVAAGENDGFGPNGRQFTMPLVASGNGGDLIPWNNENARHEAVLWRAFDRDIGSEFLVNVDNMEESLTNVWPQGTRTIQRPGTSKEELFFALSAAIERLDEDTQLLIYLTGPGGSEFDAGDVYDLSGLVIEEDTVFDFNVPDAWFESLNASDLGNLPEFAMPRVRMDIGECDGCMDWDYMINGYPLILDPDDGIGNFMLKKLKTVVPGENKVKISPKSGGMQMQNSGDPKTRAHGHERSDVHDGSVGSRAAQANPGAGADCRLLQCGPQWGRHLRRVARKPVGAGICFHLLEGRNRAGLDAGPGPADRGRDHRYDDVAAQGREVWSRVRHGGYRDNGFRLPGFQASRLFRQRQRRLTEDLS